MTTIFRLTDEAQATLRVLIVERTGDARNFYRSKDPFVEKFLSENCLYWREVATDLVGDLPSLSWHRNASDLANVRSIYGAFRHLTLVQAADMRIWSYLAHVNYWHYMMSRWPVNVRDPDNKVQNFVLNRYVGSGGVARALVRQGIARLWWYGYISFDEHDPRDPFRLTSVLFKSEDIVKNLAERSLSYNVDISKGFLDALAEGERIWGRDVFRRAVVREVSKELNAAGGVMVLDALGRDGVRELMLSFLRRRLSR